MNKDEISKSVLSRFPDAGLKALQVADIITATFEVMTEGALRDGQAVIGKHKFEKVERKARTGRLFKSGDSVTIPAKTVIKYKRVGA